MAVNYKNIFVRIRTFLYLEKILLIGKVLADFRMEKIFEQLRALPGDRISLNKWDTAADGGMKKEQAKDHLQEFQKQLFDLQEQLYAEDSRSILLIFQAMDAAGKDGAIAHVMSGVNPQGCQVFSFKQPTSLDYDHDFLWRHYNALPERGRIGIHNRSHYEYVLVCKVHPEYLLKERLHGYKNPDDFDKKFWKNRYDSIRQFEQHLHRNGTTVLKFFLHVSKEEQKARFLERIDDDRKNWKFSAADVQERGFWDVYQQAYEEAIEATSTDESPWYIIPADKKWFARLAIGKIIVDTLEKMDPRFPKLPDEEKAKLAENRAKLEGEA
ncbi:polyphosphate:nucleotide phosphotransferase, PPK2 family [bacterium A37T11]|nr:polyphosphate:nucleotide phosphotransferase, PPK2 family [bacterium A37T11]